MEHHYTGMTTERINVADSSLSFSSWITLPEGRAANCIALDVGSIHWQVSTDPEALRTISSFCLNLASRIEANQSTTEDTTE